MVCSDPPDGFYRWTLKLILETVTKKSFVKKGKTSEESVRVILEENDLKPWLEKMWCIEELSEEYIERMEKVLDVYEKEFNSLNPVICMDEKPVPLIDDVRERIQAQPGSPAKIDYEYERNG